MKRGTAIVTGAGKRIGAEIALRLADEGFKIALHYNSSEKSSAAILDRIREKGVDCKRFECDFNNAREVSKLVSSVFSAFPDCNVLVNNASIFERAGFMETNDELFDRHFSINFKAPFILSRDFASLCKEGSIVNILDAKIGSQLTSYFAYSISKKALAEFTKLAAKELAPQIRVNAVCPGVILAPESAPDPASYIEKLSSKVPMRRSGLVADITSAVLFLLDNEYVTGEYIYVDGGEHLT